MSKSQSHGKTWEDHMKAGFPGAADAGRSHTSPWDIEPEYDNEFGYPTWLETLGNTSYDICLADARKVWKIRSPYRLLIGRYIQHGDVKAFFQVVEILIHPEQHLRLLGDVSWVEVEEFHNNIQRSSYPEDEDARKFAKSYKAENLVSRSLIKLNQKIKGSQRRIQCSLSLNTLLETFPELVKVYQGGDFYRNMSVALSIKSSAREFRK